MATLVIGGIIVALVELAYMSGYYRWNCPARDLHDALSRREGVRE